MWKVTGLEGLVQEAQGEQCRSLCLSTGEACVIAEAGSDEGDVQVGQKHG